MVRESEVKLPLLRIAGIREKCFALGAQEESPRSFEDNLVFDMPQSNLLGRGMLLRLRRFGEETLVTFKGKTVIGDGLKHREEIEFHVESFDAFRAFLEHLGYAVCFRYQKYRQVFRVSADCFGPDFSGGDPASPSAPQLHIMLDETPIGDFMELEGNEELIHAAAAFFGYSRKKYITASYAELYRETCRRQNIPLGMMVFEQSDST